MRSDLRAKIVAGVMSGTSADGVDVALVRIAQGKVGVPPRLKVLGHQEFPYPKALQIQVLRAMEGEVMTAAQFSQMNWQLGKVYADCVEKASAKLNLKPSLVGLHGQTIFHKATRATWQIGEPAVLRERLAIPVVSDFRPADVAAGGQGAPLVPMLDYCLFRSKTMNRVLLNLGGIANVTVIPAGSTLDGILAFDTGPANMVIDALMRTGFGKSFDRGGKVASGGHSIPGVVSRILRDAYFSASPPKSCGREQFGVAFVERLRQLAPGAASADLVATATELTVVSILDAYGRFCWSHLGQRVPLARVTQVVASGGGVKNMTLMLQLKVKLQELGVKLLTVDELGLSSSAKEAAAFALLAWLSYNGLTGNVPAATGATGPRVLGKITC